MTKIFIVSAGTYSDYHIDSVFSSRKDAEKRASFLNEWSAYNKDECYVEEWELDAPLPTERKYITVYMWKDGYVDSTYKSSSEDIRSGFAGYYYGFKRLMPLNYEGNNSETFAWMTETDDEELAVKITAEKLTFILANNVWGNREGTITLFGQKE